MNIKLDILISGLTKKYLVRYINKLHVSRSKIEVRAIRDIKKGEEVTASYIGSQNIFLDAGAKQAKLKENWGFQCSCFSCSSDKGNEMFGQCFQSAF